MISDVGFTEAELYHYRYQLKGFHSDVMLRDTSAIKTAEDLSHSCEIKKEKT